jgi:hypothetical protein
VVDATRLTQKQTRAFMLADNKLASLAEWDEVLLKEELIALEDFDYQTIGFDADEVEDLLADDPPEGGSGGSPRNTLSYSIVFDTVEQQDKFFEFVGWLKEKAEGETIGERIAWFVVAGLDQNYGV